MKALILAAGRGTRISRYLKGQPKCTVEIGERRLIQYTVELLRNRGIKEIAVVLGYEQEVIRAVLKEYDICYYYNPFFDITNSIVSIWFAKEFLSDEDILIMNGDVFMEPSLLDMILNSSKNPVLFSDEMRKEEADYKFYYENGVLKKYGKNLSIEETTGEYIGIARLKKSFVHVFRERLEWLINKQQHSVWWENVLYSLTDSMEIYVEDVQGKFWAEIDYVEDYERIKQYIETKGLVL